MTWNKLSFDLYSISPRGLAFSSCKISVLQKRASCFNAVLRSFQEKNSAPSFTAARETTRVSYFSFLPTSWKLRNKPADAEYLRAEHQDHSCCRAKR